MAGLGFKDFQVGEVLTSSDVDGYLMQQAVMRFADSGARGSALGTAPGTAVALAEGMVSYLDDTNTVQMYDGNAWVGIGNFSASTAIVATDASWPVPTLADPIVRVTCIGGGGGGNGFNGAGDGADGTDGSASSFACAAGTVIASGGDGARGPEVAATNGAAASSGWVSHNAGRTARGAGATTQSDGGSQAVGGSITVAYLNLSGIATANVTVGAGGAGGNGTSSDGSAGGNGVVLVEYRAG